MTFTGRLILGTVLVLVVTLTALVVGIDRTLRSDLEGDVRETLERQVVRIAEALEASGNYSQRRVRELAGAAEVRISVIDSAGRVLADSELDEPQLARLESHLDRPEVQDALADGRGAGARRSTTVGGRLMYVAVRSGPGVVRLGSRIDQLDLIVRGTQRPVLLAALLALVLGLGLAVLTGRRLARPLAEAAAAARAIALGSPPDLPWSGIRDIDRLVLDLRDMHRQLSDRYDALHQRQSETAAIVDAMVEGVLSSDASGRVVAANPAARRLLGFSPSDPIPELPLLFRSREARETVLAVLAGQQAPEREVEIGNSTCLLNARPTAMGGAVVVLHNVTRLKRLEVVRRDFVANVSHELKTPLTAISGYAETLLTDTVDQATIRRFAETILANARRMQRLVDDQLDLSRIESGHWTARPQLVDAGAAAREAWDQVYPRNGLAPRLELGIDPEASAVWADPDGLRQVLRNLLENAIRHTPPDGAITVSTGRFDSGTRLTVADTGSGIGTEHLPRIFERFYRVDPGRSREQGGTGLGLSIVRHLVEAHGGRAWAESELGRGTAVHCWFPPAAG